MDESDDDDLMARVAGGDRKAFAVLVQRHLDRVVATAERILVNRPDAEDVAQDALLRLWRHAPRWHAGRARLSTWLYRVTINLCLDRRRRPQMQALDDVPEPVDPGTDGFASVHRSQTARRVGAALAGLPPRQRAALALCHYQGLSQAEAASVLDVSVKSVESLLVRARRQLRGTLVELVENNRSGIPS